MSRIRSRPIPGKPRHRQLSLWKKLLFTTVVGFAFFALVEVALWSLGVATLVEKEDPFRGFSGLVTAFTRDGEVYRTRRSNLDTFNDQSFLATKPLDGFRIFCLGGSSSHGFPWGAQAAFTGIVGDALSASHPELHIEAVNASGVSYAMHRLNIVADELLAYEPDALLVYSGHNEFIEPAFFEALKRRGTTRNQLEYLLAHSRGFSAMRSAVEGLRTEKPSAPERFETRVRRDKTRVFSRQERAEIVTEYRWRLERLVRRARAAGVKVLLATVPCNLRQWRPRSSSMAGMLSEADRQNWSEAFSSGKRQLKTGDFTVATARLEQAAQLAPHHAETQFLLGQAYEGLTRWNDARTAYQRACNTDDLPDRRVSGINDAIREVAREEEVLLVDVDRIFEQRSEHGLVGFNLIEDYVHPTWKGHELIAWHVWDTMEQAGWFGINSAADRNYFDHLVAQRRRPMTQNAQWLYNQGVVLKHQGQTAAAIEKYRQALTASPNFPAALQNLAGLLNETGQPAEAIGLCERLVEIDPASAEAQITFASALGGLGRFEEAIPYCQEALRLKPNFARAHTNLGNALGGLGRFEEAVAHYREALRLQPELAEVHNNWGNALAGLGRVEEAVAHYEEALRLKPDDANAHDNLGNALAGLGRSEEAVAHLEEALWLQPDDAKTHNHLGSTLAGLGRFQEAVAHYKQALRLKPDYLEAGNNYAWLLATCPDAQVRDGQQALELADHVSKVTRYGTATVLDTLAAAHAEVGNFEEAVRWQEKAVQLAPEPQQDILRRRLELYRSGQPFREGSQQPANGKND